MKNSERLISFLSMTLQRCASLCQYRQTNKEEDFEAGITEKQSLQTALGLITTVVTASNVQVCIDLICVHIYLGIHVRSRVKKSGGAKFLNHKGWVGVTKVFEFYCIFIIKESPKFPKFDSPSVMLPQ